MVITFYGESYTKIQLGDVVVAFNPIDRSVDAKAPKFGADLGLVSAGDPRFNSVDNLSFGAKMPFIIDGPGEYERGGIFIRGFASTGPGDLINTVYTLVFDNIRLCHLGALAKPELSAEVVEDIGAVDVLFVPIGGGDVLDTKAASKVISLLEPKMVIPTMFGDSASLKKFQQELGGEANAAVDKLAIKKKDLEGKEAEVVVIKSF